MNTNEAASNNYLLPIAVIGAGLLIAGAVMWNGSAPSGPPGTGGTPSVNAKDVKTDGAPFVGSADAPLTIIEWADFQCPYCKNFEVQTFPQILKEYVNTGKVRYVFLDLAFLGPDSVDAARYSRAVWKLYPDKYLEWRSAMYAAQDAEHEGFGNAASIDKLNATIVGLDAAKVAADVKANGTAYQALIDADKDEAQKVGISSTPSFIVGTQGLVGALPFESFKATIEAELKK